MSVDDASQRMDKFDGRNMQNTTDVLHIIAHKFLHTSSTDALFEYNKIL